MLFNELKIVIELIELGSFTLFESFTEFKVVAQVFYKILVSEICIKIVRSWNFFYKKYI